MKHQVVSTIWSALVLLIGCQQAESSQEAGISYHPSTADTIQPVAATPNTIAKAANSGPSAALLYGPLRSSADTLLRIGGQRLYLELRARLDTTQRLVEKNGRDTAASGYQGYFSFVLRDSLHQLLAKRVLTKQAFYNAVGHELVISSRANLSGVAWVQRAHENAHIYPKLCGAGDGLDVRCGALARSTGTSTSPEWRLQRRWPSGKCRASQRWLYSVNWDGNPTCKRLVTAASAAKCGVARSAAAQ